MNTRFLNRYQSLMHDGQDGRADQVSVETIEFLEQLETQLGSRFFFLAKSEQREKLKILLEKENRAFLFKYPVSISRFLEKLARSGVILEANEQDLSLTAPSLMPSIYTGSNMATPQQRLSFLESQAKAQREFSLLNAIDADKSEYECVQEGDFFYYSLEKGGTRISKETYLAYENMSSEEIKELLESFALLTQVAAEPKKYICTRHEGSFHYQSSSDGKESTINIEIVNLFYRWKKENKIEEFDFLVNTNTKYARNEYRLTETEDAVYFKNNGISFSVETMQQFAAMKQVEREKGFLPLSYIPENQQGCHFLEKIAPYFNTSADKANADPLVIKLAESIGIDFFYLSSIEKIARLEQLYLRQGEAFLTVLFELKDKTKLSFHEYLFPTPVIAELSDDQNYNLFLKKISEYTKQDPDTVKNSTAFKTLVDKLGVDFFSLTSSGSRERLKNALSVNGVELTKAISEIEKPVLIKVIESELESALLLLKDDNPPTKTKKTDVKEIIDSDLDKTAKLEKLEEYINKASFTEVDVLRRVQNAFAALETGGYDFFRGSEHFKSFAFYLSANQLAEKEKFDYFSVQFAKTKLFAALNRSAAQNANRLQPGSSTSRATLFGLSAAASEPPGAGAKKTSLPGGSRSS